MRKGPLNHVLATGALMLLAGLAAPALAAPTPAAQPVIIDTDVGDDIDDAFALALAASDRRLQVLGVTTAFGDTHKRALLVRRLLAAAGRGDIPVAEGVSTPDPTPFTQSQWASRAADASPAPDAIAFIAEQARKRPGEITLVELAPMTNLEALMQRFPDALPKLKQVVFMGGSVRWGYERGGAIPDPTPSAEYNIAMRPKALDALLKAGVPLVMFPLDSTQLKLDEVRRDRLFAYGSPTSDALALLYHQWRLWNGWGQITPTLFDAVPVAWLIDPGVCAPAPLRLSVGADGRTVEEPGQPNARACLSLREDQTLGLIMDRLAPAAPEGASR